jgi:phosphoglycolate phosphatase
MNLLFDLDGTLTDPALGITRCLAHACERLGAPVPSPDVLACYIGPPLHGTFRKLLATDNDQVVAEAVAAYPERFTSVGLYENTLIEGVPPVLRELARSGHWLWVATSKPHVYADRIIYHFDLRPFFLKVYVAELDGTRSAKADLLEHLLSTESLQASETLMVGDREHDVLGARAVGMRAIAVRWGYGSDEELAAAAPAWLVHRPAEIPDVIAAAAAERLG